MLKFTRTRLVVLLTLVGAITLGTTVGLSALSGVSANQPNAGLEFRLAVGGCDTAGDTKQTCPRVDGSTFIANVYLEDISGLGNGAYDAMVVTIAYAGLTSNDDPNIVWPSCVFEAPATGPGFTSAGCAFGISAPSSTFTGLVFTASFNCTADGTLSLEHNASSTSVTDGNGKTSVEAGPDALNIDCGPDIDADGDGCLLAQELGDNPATGGQRDPNNFWDFADMPAANSTPTLDRRVRVDDILRVVQRYNANDAGGSAPINRYSDPLSPPPKTGYHPAFDRTYVGPNDWNLTGPSVGRIRIDDVLNVVNQYGHSCG